VESQTANSGHVLLTMCFVVPSVNQFVLVNLRILPRHNRTQRCTKFSNTGTVIRCITHFSLKLGPQNHTRVVIMHFFVFLFMVVISFSLHAMLPLLANEDEYIGVTIMELRLL